MNNIITLGNGFIANQLPYFKFTQKIDLNIDQIKNIIKTYQPDVIVNAIGFCGSPNIDECEIKKVKTYNINTILPILLAQACMESNVRLIHLSSGCVFYPDQKSALYTWKEDDITSPLSTYSKSKYMADQILETFPIACILRLRMPIASEISSRNLITKILKYSKIINSLNSVTFIEDLIRCIDFMSQESYTGIYHVVNPEPLKLSSILEEYKKYFPDHHYSIISEKELNMMTLATRSNCILSTEKLSKTGFNMQPTKIVLEKTVKNYCQNLQERKLCLTI